MVDEATLIEAVRRGCTQSFGELYARHVAAAYGMARQVSRAEVDADDLVSEAFAKVLDTMRRGGGPTTAFRAYLLTSVRNLAANRSNRDRRLYLADDLDSTTNANPRVAVADSSASEVERSLAAEAFVLLPKRWRIVLWHMEVEQRTPAEVASRFGMTRNGVSALAYRARKGLREAYLQVQSGQLAGPRSHGVPTAGRTGERAGRNALLPSMAGTADSLATEAA